VVWTPVQIGLARAGGESVALLPTCIRPTRERSRRC